MNKKTIMIFPEFNNISIINNIRKKYDPLADLVLPHITLVFPFESDLTTEELNAHLERQLTHVHPFKIELEGFSKLQDDYGNFLFLNIVQGIEEIKNIHKSLYKDNLNHFDSGRDYVPHMTVGKLPTVGLLDKAFNDVNKCHTKFNAIIKKVSVEMIGQNEKSIIVIEHELK